GALLGDSRSVDAGALELERLGLCGDAHVLLVAHAPTPESKASYTDSGCCRLSMGTGRREADAGATAIVRLGSGSKVLRSMASRRSGRSPVVPWTRQLATSSSQRSTARLAVSTSSRRLPAFIVAANGTTKLPLRYPLNRSTLPLVLARYGLHTRGTKPYSL